MVFERVDSTADHILLIATVSHHARARGALIGDVEVLLAVAGRHVVGSLPRSVA